MTSSTFLRMKTEPMSYEIHLIAHGSDDQTVNRILVDQPIEMMQATCQRELDREPRAREARLIGPDGLVKYIWPQPDSPGRK